MPRWTCLMVIPLAVISCSGGGSDNVAAQRIARFETGLVSFTSVEDLFQAGPVKKEDLKTLAERMVHYHTPGVSMAVIEDFKLGWAKAYGVLRAVGDQPAAVDSYFEAASTSKLVTAAIVLHYVGKRVLSLDEDINTYLRSWKLPENDLTKTQRVTLRLLLTHQAGLPATNFPRKEGAPDPTLVQILKGEPPALNKPAVVECVPGTKWQYSNIGYVVIQQILEDAVGAPFAEIARETVFMPLGMKHSTFAYPLDVTLQAKEAWPHDSAGMLRKPSMSPPASAHGGLMTTASDLASFGIELMRAYSGRSNRVVSAGMARQMFTKVLDLDPAVMGGLPVGEGLGVFLYGEGDDLVFLHPGGNSPGTNCWLFGNPKTGRGAAIMTNGADGEVLALEIIAALQRGWLERSGRSPQ